MPMSAQTQIHQWHNWQWLIDMVEDEIKFANDFPEAADNLKYLRPMLPILQTGGTWPDWGFDFLEELWVTRFMQIIMRADNPKSLPGSDPIEKRLKGLFLSLYQRSVCYSGPAEVVRAAHGVSQPALSILGS
jgi:hypothetical protein